MFVLREELEKCTFLQFKTRLKFSEGKSSVKCVKYASDIGSNTNMFWWNLVWISCQWKPFRLVFDFRVLISPSQLHTSCGVDSEDDHDLIGRAHNRTSHIKVLCMGEFLYSVKEQNVAGIRSVGWFYEYNRWTTESHWAQYGDDDYKYMCRLCVFVWCFLCTLKPQARLWG